jgi:hypothetical protein
VKETHQSDLAIPVQYGPPYRCFRCGAPATIAHGWLVCGSRLDAWREHIAYLQLTPVGWSLRFQPQGVTCSCADVSRVVRVGHAITPLRFNNNQLDFPDWEAMVEHNVQQVAQAVELLMAQAPR